MTTGISSNQQRASEPGAASEPHGTHLPHRQARNEEVMKSKLMTAQDQADAQASLTNTAIGAAEANYSNAVKVRRRLDATQPQDRATAQATYDQAAATEENDRTNLKRQQALLAKGFVAQSGVDQAVATEKAAAAQMAAARMRLNQLELEQQAEREAADARTAQAKAQLENARAQAADIRNRADVVKEAEGAAKQEAMLIKQAEANLATAQANRAKDAIARQDIVAAKASVA